MTRTIPAPMPRPFRPLTAIASLLLAMVLLAPFDATGAEDMGTMNAIASEPMKPGRVIQLRSLDDNESNLALEADIRQALKRAGYQLRDDADLVLTFETRQTEGAYSSNRRTILEVEGENATGDDEYLKTRMSIFNSKSGGVLNKGRESGTKTVTAPQYRLDFFLDDRSNGKRVWQGWATADLGLRDAPHLNGAMVPFLVQNLGKTVKNNAFELP